MPNDQSLNPAWRILRSERWARLCLSVCEDKPWCCDPYGAHARWGRKEPSRQVHHVIAIEEAPRLAFVRSNLAALCDHCQAGIDWQRYQGIETSHLFSDGQ